MPYGGEERGARREAAEHGTPSSDKSLNNSPVKLGPPDNRVHVFARVKPLAADRASESVAPCVKANSALCQAIHVGPVAGERTFTFDGVFDPFSDQEEVYAGVGRPVLQDVMKGMHGCILAYGQTGSGKTHSLLNAGDGHDASHAGLVPRLISELFVNMAADFSHVYFVSIAMYQIYNEQVDDLLQDAKTATAASHNLKVRHDSKNKEWYVEDLSWMECTSPESLMEWFHTGRKHLRYAETHMNKHSSRSHAVMQLKVTKRPRVSDEELEKQGSEITLTESRGKMTIVDLAGSERVKKTQPANAIKSAEIRFKEATNINTSLLAIGNVVQALASGAKHVPFRESNLTRLLEGSLGGSCRTSLVVCVSAETHCWNETYSTLEFASRAMHIKAKPMVYEELVDLNPEKLANDLASAYRVEMMEQLEAQRKRDEISRKVLQENLTKMESKEHVSATRAMQAEKTLRDTQVSLLDQQKELTVCHARIAQLEQHLQEEKAQKEEAKQLLVDALAIMDTERRENETKLSSMTSAHEALVAELKASHDSQLQAAAQDQQRIVAAASRAEQAASQLVQTQAALEAAVAERNEVESEAQATARALALVQAQLCEEGSKKAALRKREAELETKAKDLNGKLMSLENELVQMREACAAEKLKWSAEKKLFEGVIATMQKGVTTQAEAMAASASSFEDTLNQIRSEAAENIAELERKLVSAQSRAGHSEAEMSIRIEAEEAKVAALRKDLKSASAEKQTLQAEVDHIQQKQEQLQSEVEERTRAAASAKADLSTAKKEVADANAQLDQVNRTILKSGVFFKKRSKAGKGRYPRFVRIRKDMRCIEWGTCKNIKYGMGIQPGTGFHSVQVTGNEAVVVGVGRELQLIIEDPEQRAWLDALTSILAKPGTAKLAPSGPRSPQGREANGADSDVEEEQQEEDEEEVDSVDDLDLDEN